jgi:hypothetical protein
MVHSCNTFPLNHDSFQEYIPDRIRLTAIWFDSETGHHYFKNLIIEKCLGFFIPAI